MWKYGSKNIREHKSWTDDNGITHPSNWHIWSAADKEAAGLTEVMPETPPDSRLYNWGYEADGVTISKTAKALDDINEVDENGDPLLDDDGVQVVTKGVKSNLIDQVRTQQGSLLSQTDWALVRFVDTAVAVPANIQTWRDAIRAKATEMETAITAADTDAVAALFVTYTVEDDGTTTKSGILYDWPELG